MSHAEKLRSLGKQWGKATTTSWRDKPPTEKQMAVLERYKETIPKTRGEASDMIDEIIKCVEENDGARDCGPEPWED